MHAPASPRAENPRTPFSILQLKPRGDSFKKDNDIRCKQLHLLFGWDSFEDLEHAYAASVGPFMAQLRIGNRLDPKELITSLLAGKLKPEAMLWTIHSQIHPLDFFALPFRHICRAESLELLAFDYGVRCVGSFSSLLSTSSEQHMSTLLYNAALLVALLWAPRHMAFPSVDKLMAEVSPRAASVLPPSSAHPCVIILADCTEILCESSGNLILQLYLYSSKTTHVHSVKLFTVTDTKGRIVWRALLKDGVTKEITGLIEFFESDEFQQMVRAGVKVFLLADRAFVNLPDKYRPMVTILTPGERSVGDVHGPLHTAWKMVRADCVRVLLTTAVAAGSARRGGTHKPALETLPRVRPLCPSAPAPLLARVLRGDPLRLCERPSCWLCATLA